MGEDPPTQQKGSFWLSLPGILTASATALGAVTALVTALYTAGIVGQPKPDAKSTPPPVTQVPASTQPAAEESSQKIDDARQQEQTAAEALRKSKAEAEQLRRELTVTKQKEAEARKLAELEAAKRRAEEAERARVAAEAELERLKRERETSRSATQDAVVRAPDAILDYKAGVSGTDVTVEVLYTFDRARKGPVYAIASLLYQGKRIAGLTDKPQPLAQPKGTARIRLTVRTDLGRQSDELEVYLVEGKDRLTARRFPFARTFDGGAAPSSQSAAMPVPSAADAILACKVARVQGAEVTIDVVYMFDSSRKGPVYAFASLLYQGKRMGGLKDKPQPLTAWKGTTQMQLTARTDGGRQSDEIEVYLIEGKDRLTVRRFPFARTF